MPASREQLERDRASDSAPDPEQQDTERDAEVQRDIASTEAGEHVNG